SVDSSAKVGQLHPTVDSVEGDGARDVGHADAAVPGVQLQVVLPRHADAVAHRPPVVALRVGSGRADLSAAGLDLDARGEVPRAGLVARTGLDDGADLDLVSVPALDADAAVSSGVHRERPGRQLCVAHLAVPIAVAVAPAIAVARVVVE